MKLLTRIKMQNKSKSWTPPYATKVSFIALALGMLMFLFVASCDKPHNGTRQLAIDLTKQINDKICPAGRRPGQPCNDKDARWDADLGTVAYIYIYGVTNEVEIDDLVKFAAKFRDERDKRIPVDLTFYKDLDKSHQLKHIKLKGK